ncbi:MAG: phosphatase PAP2 family protein [Dysgonamonadaceae bacterium]|jgi:undecaprenyl-diphosphatase|nr:phosphatase PAP2 family protein [Dysgonamonadaceae bacterium]
MNEAIDRFLPYERNLFLALNGSDCPFLDGVMWTLTGRFIWAPLILFLIYMIFYKISWKEGALVLLFLVLVVTLCDQVASSVFKPMFHRFRPTHHPDFAAFVDIVKGYKGGRYGFISSHAANSFGLSVFLSLIFRQKQTAILAFLVWAALNSYSRIYLGVHFISDVLAGMIVGTIIAFMLYILYRFLRSKIFKIPQGEQNASQPYTRRHARIIAGVIGAYLLFVIALSPLLANLPH